MLLVTHPDTYSAERAYIHGVVLGEFLGLEWSSATKADGPVQITCPRDDDRRLTIADCLFATAGDAWLTERSLPKRPLTRWDLRQAPLDPVVTEPQLPVIYGRVQRGQSIFAETRDGISLAIDLFGSIFFQLTRYEELVRPARDEHERFPSSAMLSWQEGFLERPLVNEYVEVLRASIARLWPTVTTARHTFKQRLSHDVDWPAHPPLTVPHAAKMVLGDLVRRRDPGLVRTRAKALTAQRRRAPEQDPYNTFDFIMDHSEQHDLRSAFYFMVARTDARFDSNYSLEDPWIGALIKRVHARGHEVGLHPSYQTFRRPDAIRAEFELLLTNCERLGVRQDCWGGRQHFLRWDNPTTWRGWDHAGLTYDSSLGSSHDAGFRCGVCHEYPVFDLRARCQLRLRERPLIVMEMAVIDGGPSRDPAALEAIGRLRERCRMFGGEFTLLWHNSQLASQRQRRLYQAAISASSSLGSEQRR